MREFREIDEDIESIERPHLTKEEITEIIRTFNKEFLKREKNDKIIEDDEIPLSEIEQEKLHLQKIENTDTIDIKHLEGSLRYPVKMWYPKIKGTEIESIGQLVELVKNELSGIYTRSDFPELVRAAKIHFNLIQEYQTKKHLLRGDIPKIAKRTEFDEETIRVWLRKYGKPRIYYVINLGFERKEKVEDLLLTLNGVTSFEEMERRHKNSYLYNEMCTLPSFEQNQDFSKKYYSFIQDYLKGGRIFDIVQKLGISSQTAYEWIHDIKKPTNVTIASLIPFETPTKSKKWLPIKQNSSKQFPDLVIQVPLEISSPNDILEVLEQMAPIRTIETERYERKFGEMPRDLAFMYLVGQIISDGGFQHHSDSSARVILYASKKYSWCMDMGAAFCYSMGRVGISTQRWTDNIREKNGKITECMVWSSMSSSFLIWVKKTLLGLDASSQKSQFPLSADWIMQMPVEWRKKCIQGIADGDGHASILSFNTGLTTTNIHDFYKRLFSSLGIQTQINGTHIVAKKHEEILKARNLPLFRHADSRIKELEDLCKIIQSLKTRKAVGKELELILELHKKGLSNAGITKALWYDYGIARSPTSIFHILKRK